MIALAQHYALATWQLFCLVVSFEPVWITAACYGLGHVLKDWFNSFDKPNGLILEQRVFGKVCRIAAVDEIPLLLTYVGALIGALVLPDLVRAAAEASFAYSGRGWYHEFPLLKDRICAAALGSLFGGFATPLYETVVRPLIAPAVSLLLRKAKALLPA